MTKHICHCGKISDRPQCPSHETRRGKQSSHARGYGSRWQRVRAEYVAEHPTCEDCEKLGIVRITDEVHHIVPMADAKHLAYEFDNLAALCRQCHAKRHGKVL